VAVAEELAHEKDAPTPPLSNQNNSCETDTASSLPKWRIILKTAISPYSKTTVQGQGGRISVAGRFHLVCFDFTYQALYWHLLGHDSFAAPIRIAIHSRCRTAGCCLG